MIRIGKKSAHRLKVISHKEKNKLAIENITDKIKAHFIQTPSEIKMNIVAFITDKNMNFQTWLTYFGKQCKKYWITDTENFDFFFSNFIEGSAL